MTMVFGLISLILSFSGILTAIPLWYLMLSRHFLHVNFRTITLIATAGVQISVAFGLIIMLGDMLGYETVYLYEKVKPILRYGSFLFYMGIFFLGVERATAVFMVSKYEKCVSSIVTFAIVMTLLITAGIVGTVLNVLIAGDNPLPKMIFITTYAVLCFIISISLIIYRKMAPRFTQGFSLQKRFQDKENGCTVPIYTCISANELFVSVVLSAFYAVMSNPEEYDEEFLFILSGLIEVIDAYRILFINIAILCNWIIWKRNQKRVVAHSADGAQYFRQLQASWA